MGDDLVAEGEYRLGGVGPHAVQPVDDIVGCANKPARNEVGRAAQCASENVLRDLDASPDRTPQRLDPVQNIQGSMLDQSQRVFASNENNGLNY